MRKRFKKSDLNRFLGHEAVADEVASSHVYGKAAKDSTSLPRRTRILPQERQSIPGYRDSMVGSITQYRSSTPVPPRKPEEASENPSHNETIIGNRPRSGTKEVPKKDAESVQRRHHFIEPPKRNFNRFD